MLTAESALGIAQDDARRTEDRDRRVGVRVPTQRPQPSVPGSITFILGCVAVICPVVLRQPSSAQDAEIGSSDHVSLVVLDDELRLDRDAADGVQDAQERLTSGLRSSIREPDRLAEPRRATPWLPS